MKEYNKNAKKIYMVFGILSFIIVILSLCYMTQFKNLWFYESVNGITANDSIPGATTSNSAFFNALANERFTYLLAEFISSFHPATGSSSSAVASWAASVCMTFYRQVNNVNTMILWLGLVSLIVFAVVLVFGNASRRIYYKSNLIVGVALPAVTVIFGLVVIIQNSMLMGQLAENYDLYSTVEYIVSAGGVVGLNTTDTVASMVANSNLNNTTFILTDIILAVVIAYSVFLMIYSVKRYNDCREERIDIIKKAVNANE